MEPSHIEAEVLVVLLHSHDLQMLTDGPGTVIEKHLSEFDYRWFEDCQVTFLIRSVP